MIPRYGPPPEIGRKYQLRPGAYALLFQGDQLLLTHQAEPEPEFQLPGGGIDPGESPLEGLYREVLEETGWTIANPRRIAAFRRFAYMPEYDIWAEKVAHIYIARPAHRRGPPRELGHTEVWTDIETAIEIMACPGSRAIAREFAR